MAFNKVAPPEGPFLLGPGESTGIWVTRGDGADFGAQWIMADPEDEGHPASLTLSDFTKEAAYRDSFLTVEPDHNGILRFKTVFVGRFFRYWVTVTNTGSLPVHFTLQGGGNV